MLSQPIPYCNWARLPASTVMSRPSACLATSEGTVMSAATAFFRGSDHRRHPLLRSGGPCIERARAKHQQKQRKAGLRSCRVSDIEAETLHWRRFCMCILPFQGRPHQARRGQPESVRSCRLDRQIHTSCKAENQPLHSCDRRFRKKLGSQIGRSNQSVEGSPIRDVAQNPWSRG